MKRTFFLKFDQIETTTRDLSIHGKDYPCFNCGGTTEWVSHGFIYKANVYGLTPIGKRIFCSNRHGRHGCGKTQRFLSSLWSERIHVALERVCLFLLALSTTQSVSKAYQKVTHSQSPRQAWRWLNKLQVRLPDFKTLLHEKREKISVPTFDSPRSSKISQILLPFFSMEELMPENHEHPFSWFQTQMQQSVM